jgi:DNA-binding CsgD family transcriptional regulator
MSNEMRFPDGDGGPSSPSLSATLSASAAGATTTRSASSTPSSIPSSSGKATTSGGWNGDHGAPEQRTLAHWIARADYLDRVGAIAECIAGTAEQSTVLGLLRDGVAALGVENAVYVSFVRDSVDVSACRFMLACDPAWCQQYLDAGCLAHDPWLAYAAHHSEPIRTSALKVTQPEQLRATELIARNGFASAVLVPAHSGPGHSRISVLCLGSPTPGYFDGDGFGRLKIGARALACELHDWWLGRIRRELIVRAHITPSDLVLLRHERQGHSSKRIADELQVSTSSINSRFQRMNTKLGVANRKLAAQLASECGLILE